MKQNKKERKKERKKESKEEKSESNQSYSFQIEKSLWNSKSSFCNGIK